MNDEIILIEFYRTLDNLKDALFELKHIRDILFENGSFKDENFGLSECLVKACDTISYSIKFVNGAITAYELNEVNNIPRDCKGKS